MAKIKSLSEQVREYIIREIKLGNVLYGEKINENELMEKLEISRTPIREALIQLSSDGILETLPRKGFFVKKISPETMSETYAIIGQLDAYAVSLAIPHITQAQISQMQLAIDTADVAIAQENYELYCDWQEKFHMAYLSVCENHTLVELIVDLENRHARRSFYSSDKKQLFSLLQTVNNQHRKILAAIVNKQKEEAAHLIIQHWTMDDQLPD